MSTLHILNNLLGSQGEPAFIFIFFSNLRMRPEGKGKEVFLEAFMMARNLISSGVPIQLVRNTSSWTSEFQIPCDPLPKAFLLDEQIACQESVKILSSLIMQFLSINDIPPVPGETHPCTNRMWQLHHQQSLPRLQFSSKVKPAA